MLMKTDYGAVQRQNNKERKRKINPRFSIIHASENKYSFCTSHKKTDKVERLNFQTNTGVIRNTHQTENNTKTITNK